MRSQRKTFLITTAVSCFLFAGVPVGNALQVRSSLYKCVVDLAEASPRMNPWAPMSSSGEEDDSGMIGVTGAHRTDFSAYVFLGVIRLDNKPKFQLNEKTLPELEKRYFGSGLGFRHSLEPLRRKDGLTGYRLTGTHQWRASKYNLVLDIVQANNMIYEIAGLSLHEPQPLKDPDIRSFMESFRLTR